ncbi:MAG: hypothetical protein DRH57_02200 [Candidatus Cloacimonadota bacterium]|nr:MAG: hypothetical protein DRH57_02200 [Candidatus Cloacimonadota bacterium]
MDIEVIADELTLKALKLVGLSGYQFDTSSLALKKAEEILKQKNCIILLGNEFEKNNKELVEQLKIKYKGSVIIVIPTVFDTSYHLENIEQIIQKAIGIKL